jgi:hypothetical protein
MWGFKRPAAFRSSERPTKFDKQERQSLSLMLAEMFGTH